MANTICFCSLVAELIRVTQTPTLTRLSATLLEELECSLASVMSKEDPRAVAMTSIHLKHGLMDRLLLRTQLLEDQPIECRFYFDN